MEEGAAEGLRTGFRYEHWLVHLLDACFSLEGTSSILSDVLHFFCLKVLLGLRLIACVKRKNINEKYIKFSVFDPKSLFDTVAHACGVPHTATSWTFWSLFSLNPLTAISHYADGAFVSILLTQ